MQLSERDRAILDFEGSWWTEPGSKGEAIRARLGFSPTGYYRRLGVLIDSEDAADYAPMAIFRLRRVRAVRRRLLFEGRPMIHPPTGERPLR